MLFWFLLNFPRGVLCATWVITVQVFGVVKKGREKKTNPCRNTSWWQGYSHSDKGALVFCQPWENSQRAAESKNRDAQCCWHGSHHILLTGRTDAHRQHWIMWHTLKTGAKQKQKYNFMSTFPGWRHENKKVKLDRDWIWLWHDKL